MLENRYLSVSLCALVFTFSSTENVPRSWISWACRIWLRWHVGVASSHSHRPLSRVQYTSQHPLFSASRLKCAYLSTCGSILLICECKYLVASLLELCFSKVLESSWCISSMFHQFVRYGRLNGRIVVAFAMHVGFSVRMQSVLDWIGKDGCWRMLEMLSKFLICLSMEWTTMD